MNLEENLSRALSGVRSGTLAEFSYNLVCEMVNKRIIVETVYGNIPIPNELNDMARDLVVRATKGMGRNPSPDELKRRLILTLNNTELDEGTAWEEIEGRIADQITKTAASQGQKLAPEVVAKIARARTLGWLDEIIQIMSENWPEYAEPEETDSWYSQQPELVKGIMSGDLERRLNAVPSLREK